MGRQWILYSVQFVRLAHTSREAEDTRKELVSTTVDRRGIDLCIGPIWDREVETDQSDRQV
jgi:hypothetical protein